MVNVKDFAKAIAKMEGYYKTGSRAQRNNNPGNIRKFTPAVVNGKKVILEGYEFYETPELGWAALEKLIMKYVTGQLSVYRSPKWVKKWETRHDKSPNLREFFEVYAPAADKNDPDNYARFVAKETGLHLDLPLIRLVSR